MNSQPDGLRTVTAQGRERPGPALRQLAAVVEDGQHGLHGLRVGARAQAGRGHAVHEDDLRLTAAVPAHDRDQMLPPL